MDASRSRVTLPQIVGYGIGDVASNLIWVTTLTYSLYYYTDVYRISAEYVAGILLSYRFFGAIIDPIVGSLVDRRHGRERARPFILWGALPLALATLLTFVPVGGSTPAKVCWALGSLLLLSTAYSVVNTAFGMLVNLMTRNADERLKLTSARMIGANFGAIFIGAITPWGLSYFGGGDIAQGFTVFMGLVGLLAAACFTLTWASCREQPVLTGAFQARAPDDRRASWRVLLGNGPWLLMVAMKFCNSTASSMLLGGLTFTSIYILEAGPGFSGTLIAALTSASFFGCWTARPLSRRLGRRSCLRLSNFGQMACLMLLAILPPSTTMALALVLVIGFLLGIREPLSFAMLSDTLDPDASDEGRHGIGLGYALAAASHKVAAGVGGAVLTALLAVSGYVPGAIDQGPAALQAILVGFAVLPAVMLLVSGVITFFYPADAAIQAFRQPAAAC